MTFRFLVLVGGRSSFGFGWWPFLSVFLNSVLVGCRLVHLLVVVGCRSSFGLVWWSFVSFGFGWLSFGFVRLLFWLCVFVIYYFTKYFAFLEMIFVCFVFALFSKIYGECKALCAFQKKLLKSNEIQ